MVSYYFYNKCFNNIDGTLVDFLHTPAYKWAEHEFAIKPPPATDQNMSFFRKGIVGDWKNHFKPEDILKFNQESDRRIIKLGYEKSPD